MYNNSITLSNGVSVPQLALGTWLIDDDKVGAAVRSAIDTHLARHRSMCARCGLMRTIRMEYALAQ